MHNTLNNYYKTLYEFVQNEKYSMFEVESMIPFERDLFIAFLNDQRKREAED